jgi:hypothetical protein
METKSNLFGTSQTAIMLFLTLMALVPSKYVRTIAQTDPDKLNHGSGRFWMYFAKATLPVVFFIILPLLMYAFNKKVRRNLLRELKEVFRNRCLSLVSSDTMFDVTTTL